MIRCLALLIALILAPVALAQDAKPAAPASPAAPLQTRWAAQVNPDAPWPEYPRPHMAREKWLNLNGPWQFGPAKEGEQPPFGKDLDEWIIVPFPAESRLSGVGERRERMWYRRTFTLPPEWDGQRILLNFGAVDWEAKVYVDGRKVGEHRGGYDSFTCDLTHALKGDGPHELIVGVHDPTDAGTQPRGKQVREPGGIWYTPCSGIWQTVWIEPVFRDAYIFEIWATPDLAPGGVRVRVEMIGEVEYGRVAIKILDGERRVAATTARPSEEVLLKVPDARLWSPESPNLYTLNVSWLIDGARVADQVSSYVALREVKIAPDEQGVNRIHLNGKPYFMVGPLDQGYWPDGIYTAPNDEALRYDIEATKQLGFNMTRKHVKVEPARWYYWADTLGLLVWQDIPSGDQSIGPNDPDLVRSAASSEQFQREVRSIIDGKRLHPSIVMWVVFNEGWGQFETERMTRLVQQHDPTRLVNSASGWTDRGVGDVVDWHHYPEPKSPPNEAKRAAVLGEFGGLGLAIPGHLWKPDHWGYKAVADGEALTRKYEEYMKKVYDLRDSAGLAAAVYTQLTDVEVECNGLLTYDRAVMKGDVERIAAVNRGDFSKMPPPPVITPITPTSEEKGLAWAYSLDKPADGWEKPGFDASGWKQGEGGFGAKGTPGAIVRTEWTTREIHLRRDFDLKKADWHAPHLRIHHDEDAEVYINGILSGKLTGYTTDYEYVPLSAEATAALHEGKNTIAVRCTQTTGGQYIDVGLVDITPGRRY